MKKIRIFVFLFLIFIGNNQILSQSTSCITASPICTSSGVSYPAQINNGTAPTGPNYSCLSTRPNPVYFTITAGTTGTITIKLSNSANRDIDWIVWGAFDSVNQAYNNCSTLGNGGASGSVIACDYSNAATGSFTINAIAGKVYILMVTNYSNRNTNISISQTGGTGSMCCPTVVTMPQTQLCAQQTMNLSPSTGGTWTSSNPSVATVSSTGVVSTISGGTVFFTFTNSGGCKNSTQTLTVTSLPIAGSITNDQTICTGTQPADLVSTGSTGNIQWQQSTNNTTFTDISGATSATLTGATIGSLSTTTYYRTKVSNSPCSDVFSNVVTITIKEKPIAGSITNNQTICTGTQPADLVSTGSTGNIQWQQSTDNTTFTDISGATSATLTGATIGSLSTTTYYRTKVSNSPCSDVFSNVVTITIKEKPIAGSITNNQTICTGTQPADLVSTGSTGNIQWQQSTDNTTFTDISGATSATLTGATIGSLSTTTYYRTKVSNSPCSDVFSNVVTITIKEKPIAGSITNDQTICTGTQPADLVSTGSTGNIQWQQSTDNATFTDISGATSATLTGATIGNLSTTTYYRTKVSNSPCSDVFSNVVTVTIKEKPIAGSITNNQTICTGTQPADLVSTGSTGNIQWQQSTDNATFTDISGATSATLTGATIGSLSTTTYYRTKVSNSPCSDVFSNVVTVTIETPTISGSNTVAVDGTIQLTSTNHPNATNPWISSDPTIATIDSNGLVTGISVGTTTITYTTLLGCKITKQITVFEDVCYKPATSPGVGGIPTKHGITSLGRAGEQIWPTTRKSAYTVIEAKTKGFVITRVASSSVIANPIEGMIVYDIALDCMSIYNGTAWKCYNTQTCP